MSNPAPDGFPIIPGSPFWIHFHEQIRRFLRRRAASGIGYALDEEKGEGHLRPCAACHGEFGAGGKKGEHPRIASQPAATFQQLKSFQSQARINLPMYPTTNATCRTRT